MSNARCPLLREPAQLPVSWVECTLCGFTLLRHDWMPASPISRCRVMFANGVCGWDQHNPNQLTVHEARLRLAEQEEA